MRIHGSIIARENGIPCVTGVPEDTRLLATGNLFSVDGYVGLVIIVCKTWAFVCEIVNHVK